MTGTNQWIAGPSRFARTSATSKLTRIPSGQARRCNCPQPTNTIGATTRATISAAMTPAPIRTPAPPPNGSGCRGTSRDTSPLQHTAGAITRPAADAPLLAGIVGRVDGNLAEPLIGVGLRTIRNRVGVPQIFANVFEGFHLLLPGLGEIGFAAGPLRD